MIEQIHRCRECGNELESKIVTLAQEWEDESKTRDTLANSLHDEHYNRTMAEALTQCAESLRAALGLDSDAPTELEAALIRQERDELRAQVAEMAKELETLREIRRVWANGTLVPSVKVHFIGQLLDEDKTSEP